MMNFKHIQNVMRLKEDHDSDLWEQLFWDVTDDDIVFEVNCNDLFYWACVDSIELTPENLPRLLQAVEDVRASYGVTEFYNAERSQFYDAFWEAGAHGALLFCCRERKMRPQKPYYKRIPAQIVYLVNACGPERDQ